MLGKVYTSNVFVNNMPRCWLEERITTEKSYVYHHYDLKSNTYQERTLIMLEALYVNHLINQGYIQEILDKKNLYSVVERKLRQVQKAVDEQTAKLSESDKELQLALMSGNMDRYYMLERNIKARAEEIIYPSMLYV